MWIMNQDGNAIVDISGRSVGISGTRLLVFVDQDNTERLGDFNNESEAKIALDKLHEATSNNWSMYQIMPVGEVQHENR